MEDHQSLQSQHQSFLHQQLVVPDVHMSMETAPGPGLAQGKVGDHASPIEVKSAALAATAFIHELSGLPPVPSDTLAAAMAAAAAAVGSSLNQIVPSSFPTSSATALPPVAAGTTSGASTVVPGGPDVKLSPSQLGELELARQRAQRAAAGRRQQLIAQKRARESAAQQKAAAQESKRPTRAAARGVAKLVTAAVDSSDEAEDSDEPYEVAGATGDATKDARKLKRLLRNRVSAQQARERKKQYVTTLEEQVKALQSRIKELESSLVDQEQQNDALRRIIRNMRGDNGDDGPGGGAMPPSAAPTILLPAATAPKQAASGAAGVAQPVLADSVLPDSISPQGSLQLGSALPAAGADHAPLQLEGTDTSQHPGFGSVLHRGFASPGIPAGAFGLDRNGSLDMFNMDLGDLEEDEDGLVVPQAPPLQELQGMSKAAGGGADHDLQAGSDSPGFPVSS